MKILLISILLVMGCAKKPDPIVPPVPTPTPTPIPEVTSFTSSNPTITVEAQKKVSP